MPGDEFQCRSASPPSWRCDRTNATSAWVFPAPTRSGHIEPGSVKRQHLHACEGKQNKGDNLRRPYGEPKKWSVEPFPLYTLRHTCLTRWAPHMDPWTLAYLAGHRDMSITKRYIHPQEQSTRAAIRVGTVLGTLPAARCSRFRESPCKWLVG